MLNSSKAGSETIAPAPLSPPSADQQAIEIVPYETSLSSLVWAVRRSRWEMRPWALA